MQFRTNPIIIPDASFIAYYHNYIADLTNAMIFKVTLVSDITSGHYLEFAFHTTNYKWPYNLGMGIKSLEEANYPGAIGGANG